MCRKGSRKSLRSWFILIIEQTEHLSNGLHPTFQFSLSSLRHYILIKFLSYTKNFLLSKWLDVYGILSREISHVKSPRNQVIISTRW